MSSMLSTDQNQDRSLTTIDLTSLMALPAEIHLEIKYYLDPLDIVAFKLTSSYFNALIPRLRPAELSLAQNHLYKRLDPSTQHVPGTDLITANNAPHPYLACMSCLRLRPSNKFADEQFLTVPMLKVRPRVKKLLNQPCGHTKRFCIECGLRLGKKGYERGAKLKIDGKLLAIERYSCVIDVGKPAALVGRFFKEKKNVKVWVGDPELKAWALVESDGI